MSEAERTTENGEDHTAAFPCPEDSLFDFPAYGPVIPSEFSRKEDWYVYINGYKDAADFLVSNAPTRGNPRKLLYPVLFLYRHHLELALKAIIGKQKKFPRTHELDELWQDCRSLLDEISLSASDNDEIQQTTRLIDEFCKVDPKSALAFDIQRTEIYPKTLWKLT